jgi:hypothetical protein
VFVVVATTANRETGKSAQLRVRNAQHSAQAMREYAVKAGEINTEMAKRTTEVWVEGLQKHTQLSQKIAQEFIEKAKEQGRHGAEEFFDGNFPSWWAAYSSSTYDPVAFWRMWAQTLQEAAEERARVIERTAPWNGSLPIPGYDEKKVEEITSRLDALTDEQLRRVRDYERRNKNRETLVREIEGKIRGAS